MNCIAFLTDSINHTVNTQIVSQLSKDNEVDIFEIPNAKFDGGKRDGNITFHFYKHSVISHDRFTEVMRDLLAVHPSKCYICINNDFGNKAYQVCTTYGIPVTYYDCQK